MQCFTDRIWCKARKKRIDRNKTLSGSKLKEFVTSISLSRRRYNIARSPNVTSTVVSFDDNEDDSYNQLVETSIDQTKHC